MIIVEIQKDLFVSHDQIDDVIRLNFNGEIRKK